MFFSPNAVFAMKLKFSVLVTYVITKTTHDLYTPWGLYSVATHNNVKMLALFLRHPYYLRSDSVWLMLKHEMFCCVAVRRRRVVPRSVLDKFWYHQSKKSVVLKDMIMVIPANSKTSFISSHSHRNFSITYGIPLILQRSTCNVLKGIIRPSEFKGIYLFYYLIDAAEFSYSNDMH